MHILVGFSQARFISSNITVHSLQSRTGLHSLVCHVVFSCFLCVLICILERGWRRLCWELLPAIILSQKSSRLLIMSPYFKPPRSNFSHSYSPLVSDICLVEIDFLCFMCTVIFDVWNASLLRKTVKAQSMFLFKIRQNKESSGLFSSNMDHLVHSSSSRAVLGTVMIPKDDICILLWLLNIPGVSWKNGPRRPGIIQAFPSPRGIHAPCFFAWSPDERAGISLQVLDI